MSQLVQEGLNWVIIDHITDLGFADELIASLDQNNFNMYTSAKGVRSTQNYLIPPRWLPNSMVTEPAIWPQLKKWLEAHIQKQLVHHCKMPDNWHKLYAYSAWCITGHEGSYHTLHDHGPNNVSAVIYLDVPKNQEDPQGQIYFVLHSDGYNNLNVPKTRTLHFHPTKGSLIIFPSWIPHGVYPQGPGIRRTLNVDFNGNPNFNFDDPAAGHMTYSGRN